MNPTGSVRRGDAGVVFPANVGPDACICLCEGRGELIAAGDAEAITDDSPELLAVSQAWGLVLAEPT